MSLFSNPLMGSSDRWGAELQEFQGPNFTIESKYANGWGSFKLIEATLDAMAHFRDSDYDYFINLSGQCYPLQPVRKIKERLEASNGYGFLECNPLPWDRWVDERGGFRRLDRKWYKPFKTMKRVSVPRLEKELPLGMTPYGGSQWFCLPRDQVNYVLDFLEENPEVVSFFKRSLIPDELFFQTIMMNSPYRDRIHAQDNLRFIDWHKRGVPLPAILMTEDLERLVGSKKLFARKFDPQMDGLVMDLLDAHLRVSESGWRPPEQRGDAGDIIDLTRARVR